MPSPWPVKLAANVVNEDFTNTNVRFFLLVKGYLTSRGQGWRQPT